MLFDPRFLFCDPCAIVCVALMGWDFSVRVTPKLELRRKDSENGEPFLVVLKSVWTRVGEIRWLADRFNLEKL